MTLVQDASYPMANKLVKKVRQAVGRRVVSMSQYLRSRAIAEELQEEVPEAKDLDPSHGLYTAMINQVSVMTELLHRIKELSPLFDRMEKAQDEYEPGYPPISPLTTSFYNCWAYFDMNHGAARETLGTTCLTLGRAFGMHPERIRILETLCDSRMGFFVHEGRDGQRVVLRDLVTDQVSAAIVPAGHYGNKGDLWYVRLLPAPLPGLNPVVMTTPYIVLAPGSKEWENYFQRHGGAANYAQHMKDGPAWNYWTEFVFEGYFNHTSQAIFLAGLPDVAETRPHSPEFDAATLEPYEAAIRRQLGK